MENFNDLFLTSCAILIFIFLILWILQLIVDVFVYLYYATRNFYTGVTSGNQRPWQVSSMHPQQLQLVPWGHYDDFGVPTIPVRQYQNRRRFAPTERSALIEGYYGDVEGPTIPILQYQNLRRLAPPERPALIQTQKHHASTPTSLRTPDQLEVKPKQQKYERYSPFLAACWDCDLDKIGLQIMNGADTLEKTQQGETGLVLATYTMAKGKRPWDQLCLRLLIDNGCSVNEPTNDKNTALHLAVKAGHIDIVKWLLTNGACVRAQNKSGWRPMTIAKAQGRTDIAAILWDKYFETQEAESTPEESSEYYSAMS